MHARSMVLAPYRYDTGDLSALQVTALARTTCYGPVALGDGSQGLQTFLWGGYIDESGRVYIAKKEDEHWGAWVESLTLLDPIASLTLAFDLNGFPMIAYVRENLTFGVWYRPLNGVPQLIDIDTLPSRFSLLSLSATTDEPAYRDFADVVLACGNGTALNYWLGSEGFTQRHVLDLTANYDRIWLARTGISVDGRFQITLKA